VAISGGFADLAGYLAPLIDGLIEEVSQRPLTNGDPSPVYVSNAETFDPRMNPIDYERYCACQLQKATWQTRVTVATGDQGADIIAKHNNRMLVVQCKLYGSPVGNDAVQQVFAARQLQHADIAAVISNQPFTKSARQLADVNGALLMHHDELPAFAGPQGNRNAA
jgi:restriction system protein